MSEIFVVWLVIVAMLEEWEKDLVTPATWRDGVLFAAMGTAASYALIGIVRFLVWVF